LHGRRRGETRERGGPGIDTSDESENRQSGEGIDEQAIDQKTQGW
jgi:hypothetical protein